MTYCSYFLKFASETAIRKLQENQKRWNWNVASAYGPSLSYLIDEELNILQRKTHKLPNIASN